jgi:hypothetical protein
VDPTVSRAAEPKSHGSVLAGLVAEVPGPAGNLVHDAHTIALMRVHGVRAVYTRDTDFHRFPGVEVRDPLRDE